MAYQITCDGYVLDDPRDEELFVLNPKCNLEANKIGESSFEIIAAHPHFGKLRKKRSIFEIRQDNEPIFRGRMTEDTKDFNNTKLVDLEGVLSFFNDSIIRPFSFPEDFLDNADYVKAAESGNVVEFFLKWLIDRHNEQTQPFQHFRLGRVTVSDKNNYLSRSSKDYLKTWEILKTKLFESEIGGFLCIRYEDDGNYIDYLEDFELINAQPIAYGENLLDLSSTSNASETYSAVIPLGKRRNEIDTESDDDSRLTIEDLPDGEITADIVKSGDTIYSKSAIDDYGWVCAPTTETTWEDVGEAVNLQTRGVDFLKNTGIMLKNTITIKAVDLHYSDDEIEAFRIYRYVHLKSEPHNQEDFYRLSRLEIDLHNPQNTGITIGDTRLSLMDINEVIKQNADKKAEGVTKTVSTAMKKAVTNTTAFYCISTSATEPIGGTWREEMPKWEDGKYIWMKIVVTYGDGTTSEGNPACITGSKGSTGAKGEAGSDGVSVSGVATEFYLSTSKETQSGGLWVSEMPTWSNGKYLWTRFLITYSDGSSEYTSPVCDSSWEAANTVKEELTETFNSKFEQFADEITLEITGSLGSEASIVLTAGGVEKKTTLELSKVREAFANDNTAVTISAGVITFNSGTIVINSNNFKVDADGVIEATSGTIGAITLWTSGIYSHNESFSRSFAGWYRPATIKTTENCFFAGASDSIGTNAKFLVTYGGALTATDATINGSVVTIDSPYKTELDFGSLRLYYNDDLCGTINTKYWGGASTAGISLRIEEGGNYIMFSHPSDAATGFDVDYYLNYGWSSNYDEMHIFQTSARFLDDVYLDGYTRIRSLRLFGANGEYLVGISASGELTVSKL